MTTGALIFAFNNADIDYVALARAAAKRIRRHLGLPTCVITDQAVDDFDHVVQVATPEQVSQRFFDDVGHNVEWRNHGRPDAFDLTPWDRTLLLDADYVVASDGLLPFLESGPEFLCYKNAWDVTKAAECSSLNTFGDMRFPMWWATVVIFSKTTYSQHVFDAMRMIRANWDHYRALYNIGRSVYRNDFALSIALNILSGHTLEISEIPAPLWSVMPEHGISMIDQDRFRVDFRDTKQKPRYTICAGMDLHVMGKKNLGDMIGDHS